MKILVPVKRVIDPYVKVRVKSDETGVEKDNVKMAMNPFDEIALEEAIRLKEKGLASDVCVVSIGEPSCQETLRHGLALGADRAIHVLAPTEVPSIDIAHIVKVLVAEQNFDLVLMGKQSIDGDNNQTCQMLAGLLGWPQATNISELHLEGEAAKIVREIDGGLEHLRVQLPAVISADLRLNEPRYASLPNIMKAKRKPMETKTLEALGVQMKERVKRLRVSPPPQRSAGQMLDSIDALVEKLMGEEKVL